MFETTYTYPGDPTTLVKLTYGGEFKTFVGPHRHILVTGAGAPVEIPVDEVICDSCNAEIRDVDPCSLTEWGLRCWNCTKEWILPYVTKPN